MMQPIINNSLNLVFQYRFITILSLIEQDPEQFKDAVKVGDVQILEPGQRGKF